MNFPYTHRVPSQYEAVIAFNGEVTSKHISGGLLTVEVLYTSYEEALNDVKRIYYK